MKLKREEIWLKLTIRRWDLGQRGIRHLSRTQGALPHWNLRCLHSLPLLLHVQAGAAGAARDDDVGGVADHDLLLLRLPLDCPVALRKSLVSDFSIPKTTPCSGLKVWNCFGRFFSSACGAAFGCCTVNYWGGIASDEIGDCEHADWGPLALSDPIYASRWSHSKNCSKE